MPETAVHGRRREVGPPLVLVPSGVDRLKVKSVSRSGCARTVPFSSVMLVGVPSRSLGCPGIGFCVPDPLPGAADASAESAVVGQARGQRGSRE